MRLWKGTFWQSLAAVVVGNAIYFGVYSFLPPRAQHGINRVDWGLAVDFWICLVCYGLARYIR
jgi:hypothetical protein